MASKGTTLRKVRVPDEIWNAALAAFPAERGKASGMSAEMLGFITFLAERPDAWKAVKARAEADGVGPWQLIADAVAAYRR